MGREGDTRHNFQAKGKKNMLWKQQNLPLACGIGCPVKTEIDEAKKIKLGGVGEGGGSLKRVL